MALFGKISILTPIKWGITWGITHPWHTFGGYLLLRNPYTRGWAIDHLVLFGRGAIAGARASSASTLTRLIIPAAAGISARIAPVATRIGVGFAIAAPVVGVTVGVVGTAAVVAGVHTAALQKTELIGPKAMTVDVPFWYGLGDVQINPYMIGGWGTVI